MSLGASLEERRIVTPQDDSTLFVCSGMQDLKSRFTKPDGSIAASVQTCVRTNDLELVGDGTHLTSFDMVGTFSFGRADYVDWARCWADIVRALGIGVTHVTYHPDRWDHRVLFEKLGFVTRPDPECLWSDGNIGGYCCEMYVGDLEIGNLVNTLDISVDVGFGLERMIQVMEGQNRVDDTSLFNRTFSPIARDHIRTIALFYEQGISPSNKRQGYVCRRLIRRCLEELLPRSGELSFSSWLQEEAHRRQDALRQGRRAWRKNISQPAEFWWETYGITPEEISLLNAG